MFLLFNRCPQRCIPVVLVVVSLFLHNGVASAQCNFGNQRQPTFAELFSQAEASVVARWVASQEGSEETEGRTAFRVQRILNGNQVAGIDQLIIADDYLQARPVDSFLVLGSKSTETNRIEWYPLFEASPTKMLYILQAPPSEAPQIKRLAYFINFIEHSDSLISKDALAEVNKSALKDFQELASQLPHDQIRKWVSIPTNTEGTRLGVYSKMLGVCGDASDAILLEKRILTKTDEFRTGIDAVMFGYLLLRREKGLEILEKSKMLDKTVPFSETYSAMQALRYMWGDGKDAIPHDRLRQSMRILLDRPEMADLVITDLARWKDWSVHDRLVEMYQDNAHAKSVKRAIIRFMLKSSTDDSVDKNGQVPPHVAKGLNTLRELREKDPQTVREAERFFILTPPTSSNPSS